MDYQNRFHITLVGLLFMVGILFAPYSGAESLLVSGKIIDEDTREPLAYATVSVGDYEIGTISNLAGEFEIHIPDDLHSRTLVVSMLGYVNFELPVTDAVAKKFLLISLKPGHVLLDGVTVSETLSAAELLKIALSRIELNYPMNPVEMDGFYRETKLVNNEYVDLLEAAVKIYDKDYSVPRDKSKLRERVALIEVRKTLEYDYELEKYFNQYNVLEDLLLENLVKYRTFNNEDEFYTNLSREQVVGYNGAPINLVSIEVPGYLLDIYIDDGYGIRKVVFKWGDGTTPVYTYRKSRRLENRVMFVEKEIEFQKIGGKLYLKYIAANYKSEWYKANDTEHLLTTERNQALLINRINSLNPKWISSSEKMKRYGLQFQHDLYNKDFWASYNTIKKMPLEQKALVDLERELTLEEQFEFYK